MLARGAPRFRGALLFFSEVDYSSRSLMVRTLKYATLLLLLAICSSVATAQVRLSIPDTSGVSGTKLTIPVYVDTSLTGKGVTSYQIQLSYNSSYLALDSVISTGSLSQSFGAVSYNGSTSGIVTIASAGATALSGTGVLVYVRFRLLNSGNISVSFSGGTAKNFFNEGNPAIVFQNGYVDILLASPTNLVAASITNERIDLSWGDGAGDETGFTLQRTLDTATSWATVASLGSNVTTYSDTGLNDGTKYFYRVYASDSLGNSGYSNISSAVTPMLAPDSLTAAQLAGGKVRLVWYDVSASATGYYIERKSSGTYAVIDSVSANLTIYTDSSGIPGTVYSYRVRGHNLLVTSAYSNDVSINLTRVKTGHYGAPDKFGLSQNYPNPFNPSTIITYQLPVDGHVSLEIFDALGREVETLVNDNLAAGYYDITFKADMLPSGIYFYRLVANGYVSVKKMVLLK